jgi:hypothetical protein
VTDNTAQHDEAAVGKAGIVVDRTPNASFKYYLADNEDGFVYLANKAGANDLKVGSDGSRTKYVVRKVVPEHLIYFDSLPLAIVGKDGVWTGHNVMSLREREGRTEVSVFMEHTWYSETVSIEELRADAKKVLEGGIAFWRDYFIPDLLSLVEARPLSAGDASGTAS